MKVYLYSDEVSSAGYRAVSNGEVVQLSAFVTANPGCRIIAKDPRYYIKESLMLPADVRFTGRHAVMEFAPSQQLHLVPSTALTKTVIRDLSLSAMGAAPLRISTTKPIRHLSLRNLSLSANRNGIEVSPGLHDIEDLEMKNIRIDPLPGAALHNGIHLANMSSAMKGVKLRDITVAGFSRGIFVGSTSGPTVDLDISSVYTSYCGTGLFLYRTTSYKVRHCSLFDGEIGGFFDWLAPVEGETGYAYVSDIHLYGNNLGMMTEEWRGGVIQNVYAVANVAGIGLTSGRNTLVKNCVAERNALGIVAVPDWEFTFSPGMTSPMSHPEYLRDMRLVNCDVMDNTAGGLLLGAWRGDNLLHGCRFSNNTHYDIRVRRALDTTSQRIRLKNCVGVAPIVQVEANAVEAASDVTEEL